MGSQQTSEEALCSGSISLLLKIHINNLAILIHSAPWVLLPTIDLYEYFVEEESVTAASVLSLQSAGVQSAKFVTPKADCFTTDDNASLSQ